MKNTVFRTIIRFITLFRVARWRVVAYPCKTPYSSLLAMQKALKNKEPGVIGASQIQTRKCLEFIALKNDLSIFVSNEHCVRRTVQGNCVTTTQTQDNRLEGAIVSPTKSDLRGIVQFYDSANLLIAQHQFAGKYIDATGSAARFNSPPWYRDQHQRHHLRRGLRAIT